MEERIYYISHFDNCVHNLNDVEHKLISENQALIGKNSKDNGFKVDEEVDIHTFKEIIELFNIGI